MAEQGVALKKPTREFVQFFWWLKNVMGFYPDVCIDVGAADGTPSIYQSFRDATIYAFEPLPSFLPRLREQLKNHNHEIFQMGLMEQPGSMKITEPDNEYTATLMSKQESGQSRPTLNVDISTLDIQLQDRLAGKKILLKTDCQGADLAVIKGGRNVLQMSDIVIMETSLYRFWGDHHPDFYDIVHYMKSQGFVVFDILEGMFKPSNRALGQVDLAFVKEDGILRPDHRW